MRTPLAVLLIVIAALFGLELALHAFGHWPPGVGAALGLLGSGALVGVAKGLARLGLQRPEVTDE